ncbi:hypothetical protein BZG36_00014 [Bifiguratus adelaidae]|uniref:Amidohydrolase-related domain-containing protein n=1 Tax=Bifiguratus adelaidae TaxID=1938954 RepID=A0A261Y8W8_9FUNG|nr:hypothetical protein BZG36_00014 [Bifiguratus adelaidae]
MHRTGYSETPPPPPKHTARPFSPETHPFYESDDGRASPAWSDDEGMTRKKRVGRSVVFGCFLTVLGALVISVMVLVSRLPGDGMVEQEATISYGSLKHGLAQCTRNGRVLGTVTKRTKNPRAHAGQAPVLLKNAIVWDGLGGVKEDMQVYMADGLIKEVSKNVEVEGDVQEIDVKGHIVGPGLVDMHSHLGVDSWPGLAGTDDTNEMTSPITPYVRTIDAFNPSDKAIPIVVSGGVTTALVLPGSGNLIGGEAFPFKLAQPETLSVEDMLVKAEASNDLPEAHWRYLKMACGENPKRVYGGKGEMPSTRLGSVYKVRKAFQRAQQLKSKQDAWCASAQRFSDRVGFDSLDEASYRRIVGLEEEYPEDLDLEMLIDVLRGHVNVNIHCYETHDLEAIIRVSKEFGFEIRAFHHALDAYRVPEIIKRAGPNITIATFSDLWGSKKEAFQASPYSPKILHDAGINVALKSDHPVLNSQHLIFEAAKSVHYDLPEQVAFSAVTSVPARAMRLDHRIGVLAPGYDADVVVWNQHPFNLAARPLQVYIDGVPQWQWEEVEEIPRDIVSSLSMDQHRVQYKDTTPAMFNDLTNAILYNVSRVLTGRGDIIDRPDKVVLQHGQVVCVGAECEAHTLMDIPRVDGSGYHILPGLIGVGSDMGLIEIDMERSTSDGNVNGDVSDPRQVVYAVDGIKLGGRHLEEAYKGGVLTSITAPIGSGLIKGVSTAFRTGASDHLAESTVIADAVALHVNIGHSAKSSGHPTVSSQIAFLRQLLLDHRDAPANQSNIFRDVAQGFKPLVVHTNNKDEIASIVKLKQMVDPLRVIILGGIEAHYLAGALAKHDIAVILNPVICTPADFDAQGCLTGAPLTNRTSAEILQRAGVLVGVGIPDNSQSRDLAWLGGWASAASEGRLKDIEAYRFITTNIATMFGLVEPQSQEHSLGTVVWDGHPFDMRSKIIATSA